MNTFSQHNTTDECTKHVDQGAAPDRRSIRRLLVLLLVATAVFAVGAVAPAYARNCEDCDQEEPIGGGPSSGGGGGGSGPSHTVVSGRLTYVDPSPEAGSTPKPLAKAELEIVGEPLQLVVARTSTDPNGHFSYDVPFAPGTRYFVRVYASNNAAIVFAPAPDADGDGLSDGEVPYAAVPTVGGVRVDAPSPSTAGAAIDLSFTFADAESTARFSMMEAVRHGFVYASQLRDPADPDLLGRVGIRVTNWLTFYNALSDSLIIHEELVKNDLLMLHEYAHFLEDQLSSFPWNITRHYGCFAYDIFWKAVNSDGHAWMEGFADYFAAAVARKHDKSILSGDAGTLTPPEHADACPGLPSSEFGRETVETWVASSLWDLIDSAADNNGIDDDLLADRDQDVFRIMDGELDQATWIGGPMPTILDFRRAWLARGLPPAELEEILMQNFILTRPPTPSTEPPTESEEPIEPDEDVCRQRPWLPECGGNG
jgi:hypothetical protein